MSYETPVTQSNPIAIEDSLNPFFVYHGDNPGTVLVSQLLVGQNYSTWSRSLTMAFSAQNNAWIRCNNMVLSWHLNSLSKDLAACVIYMSISVYYIMMFFWFVGLC